uniref:THAP-type domain-containing protein n=1 Tax=Cyprinus carpio TaxID=7962 RepID=A0A8C1W2Z3_CYPCA
IQSCCVPLCFNSKKKQPYLLFHSFPNDESMKRCWIWAIRRDEGAAFTVRKGSTFVCAMHFTEDEDRALPSRFSWNNWGDQIQICNNNGM